MGQTEPDGQDAESDDVRVRAFAADRDRINELRQGTERQPDVIHRLLEAYEAGGTDTGAGHVVDVDPGVIGDAVARRDMTLEAAERRAIAEEVAEVLGQ